MVGRYYFEVYCESYGEDEDEDEDVGGSQIRRDSV